MKQLFVFAISLFFLSSLLKAQTINDCTLCDEYEIPKEELEGKSMEELALLRNEIYARNGYVFQNDLYQAYFKYKAWYKPAQSNDDVKLSAIEIRNIDLFKRLEDKIQRKREAAISGLKTLTIALNNNDKQAYDEIYRKLDIPEPESCRGIMSELITTLNMIDFDQVHWNKGRGLYKILIDNGYLIRGYEAHFTEDEIRIETGDYAHSEIFGGFHDGYSDYMSENEYNYFWVFEMREEGIVFKYFHAAG